MKINKKGVTLVELIVSFALVSIAVVYFYKTLSTVYNIYSKTSKEINIYAEDMYEYKIVDQYINNLINSDPNNKSFDNIYNKFTQNYNYISNNFKNNFNINFFDMYGIYITESNYHNMRVYNSNNQCPSNVCYRNYKRTWLNNTSAADNMNCFNVELRTSNGNWYWLYYYL